MRPDETCQFEWTEMNCSSSSGDRLAHEKTLESVASASCQDLELVFLADACSCYGDVDVVHQGDGRTRKDAHRSIGRKVDVKLPSSFKTDTGRSGIALNDE